MIELARSASPTTSSSALRTSSFSGPAASSSRHALALLTIARRHLAERGHAAHVGEGRLGAVQRCFGALAVGDVAIDLHQRVRRVRALAALDRPPARNDDRAAVAPDVRQFAFPVAVCGDVGVNGSGGRREFGLQQVAQHAAGGLFGRPAIGLLGAAVPEYHPVVLVAHDDGVVGEVEQVRLAPHRHTRPFELRGAFRDPFLELVVSPAQRSLGPMARLAQHGDQHREHGKDDEIRRGGQHRAGIEGGDKDEVEHENGQQDGDDARPPPAEPDCDRDGDHEDEAFEIEGTQHECRDQRGDHGQDRVSVSRCCAWGRSRHGARRRRIVDPDRARPPPVPKDR
jgi:hypothetical protein